MKGCTRIVEAICETLREGRYLSGEAAARNGNGDIQIQDRLKDVIIPASENASAVKR